jgi:6-pyruvoyltetrahydropterin/6-carboxytetrahydropterin synthase
VSFVYPQGQYGVVKLVDFCYGHRLLNYAGKCRYLHGHNGVVEILVESEHLDDRGMVIDFSDVKRIAKTWIDDNLDHRMILCRQDPAVEMLLGMNEPLFLMDCNPTAEAIAGMLLDQLLAEGLPIQEIKLWETPSSYATVRKSR